jgi:hypothetical protein
MALGDFSREQLIAMVERIQSNVAGEQEEDRLVALFSESVPHPRASDLIFYPEHEFGRSVGDEQPTAEQIVEAALAYIPVEL